MGTKWGSCWPSVGSTLDGPVYPVGGSNGVKNGPLGRAGSSGSSGVRNPASGGRITRGRGPGNDSIPGSGAGSDGPEDGTVAASSPRATPAGAMGGMAGAGAAGDPGAG